MRSIKALTAAGLISAMILLAMVFPVSAENVINSSYEDGNQVVPESEYGNAVPYSHFDSPEAIAALERAVNYKQAQERLVVSPKWGAFWVANTQRFGENYVFFFNATASFPLTVVVMTPYAQYNYTAEEYLMSGDL